ncbi:MAG: hypothetical protein C4574_00605 [Candidatus Latescibacterota bacterium]|jgi:hypothetical protein|nr:MAG: hypothetical protein C4574_00605 [Candidatus Latescibacterota bacterium]
MNQDQKRYLRGLLDEKNESLKQLDIVIDRCRKDVSTYLQPYLPIESIIGEIQIDYAVSAILEMKNRLEERKALVDEIDKIKAEIA